MKLAYVFPGQGAQYVGMLEELTTSHAVARQVFEQADEALGFSLTQICKEGPQERLTLTYHAQPALLTASIAALRVFEEQTQGAYSPVVVAGHSLGEYTALVAGGAMEFSEAVQLVYRRGKLMDEAYPAGKGAMAAVLGMDALALRKVCEQVSAEGDGIAELANLNCPGQIVISGTADGVEKAGALAREFGAKRVIPLVVSGPFHCRLMKPAAASLKAVLDDLRLAPLQVPVVANYDADLHSEPDEVRDALYHQLYSPVRWQEDVETMVRQGVDTVIEFGPGTVLSGLIRKVERGIGTLHVEDRASLDQTIQKLGER